MSAAVALLFLLQAVSIGVAEGAIANGAVGSFGLICQSAEIDASKADSSKPTKQQHVGPCCILPCSSVIEAEGERAPAEILPLEAVSALPICDYEIDAAIVSPELRLLSPRAPPSRFV